MTSGSVRRKRGVALLTALTRSSVRWKGGLALFAALLSAGGAGSTHWHGWIHGPEPVLDSAAAQPTGGTSFQGWNGLDLHLPAGDVRRRESGLDDALDEIGTIHLRWRAEEQVDGTVFVRLLVRPSEDFVARGDRTGDWLPQGGTQASLILVTRWRVRENLPLQWSLRNVADGRVVDWPLRLRMSLAPDGAEVSHWTDLGFTDQNL